MPQNVVANVRDWYGRYGKVRLQRYPEVAEGSGKTGSMPDLIYLVSDDAFVIQEILSRKSISPFIRRIVSGNCLEIVSIFRGRLKQALIKVGYPVDDRVGYLQGDLLNFSLRSVTMSGKKFSIRPYQADAVSSFIQGEMANMSGVVVLPSGAGKTVVGMGIMEKIHESTLIITTGTVAARQWISELIDKSNLGPGSIGEYTGDSKEILPVTVTTYQVLTYSPSKKTKLVKAAGAGVEKMNIEELQPEEKLKDYPHLDIFRARNWGLIIYDEVHLLPAPVFRITSEIQAMKRLGLTATLIREDGKEEDVFSLIGPKKFDSPWKDLEKQGWIATAYCNEIRVNFHSDEHKMNYAVAPQRLKYRIAAENPAKLAVLRSLIERLSPEDSVLIIGDYVEQLEMIAAELNLPLITGKMKNEMREKLYSEFRAGSLNMLVVSKVANYAIDLPDANVAIQVSGTFGSRQEEAQRLGRLLRPKSSGISAHFYTIVTKDTVDQDYSMKRQLFLTERGYKYTIIDHENLLHELSVGDDRSTTHP